MADTLRIGAAFLDAVRNYADQVTAAANEATQISLQHVQDRLQEQAREHENWRQIAEHISVFSKDGRMVVGVQGGESMSAAQDAEFGTDDSPPVPLFRTSQRVMEEAKQKAQDYMWATLGPVPQ